jgi:hypothetical protein
LANSGKIIRKVLKTVSLSEPIGDISTLEDEVFAEKVQKDLPRIQKDVR